MIFGQRSAFLAMSVVLLVVLAGALGWAAQELPKPLGYVSDFAGVLSPEWYQRIRSVCKDVEIKTGVELLLVTLPSVGPMQNAHQYASQLYEQWRIGTAQQERGMLVLVAIQERQAVVVLGRNLLSVIDRKTLDHLSETLFVPMFQTGAYGQNLYQAAVHLATSVDHLTAHRHPPSSTGFWLNVGMGAFLLFVLWRFVRPERRHPFQRWRRGEYWGTGQGGFGGNFGGFGGGMSGQGLG